MIKEVKQKKTPLEIAREEINEEQAKKAVGIIKSKLRELVKAQALVANIEREIEDLEEAIEDGNL